MNYFHSEELGAPNRDKRPRGNNGGRAAMLETLDCHIEINGEMIRGKCEDDYMYVFDDSSGMIAVMDGCGGLGAAVYDIFDNNKGAYIASRAVNAALTEWYRETRCTAALKPDAEALKRHIQEKLTRISSCAREAPVLKGRLSRPFPTTLSAIRFALTAEGIRQSFILAGDSRGYMLSLERGLMQITTDDITGKCDALENLREDSPLSNVLSADGNYTLNMSEITCASPFIALTATDGCFGYLKTPMQFEYLFYETLYSSASAGEWQELLRARLSEHASDDYTLVMAIFGFGGFDNIKRAYSERSERVKNLYIDPLKNDDADIPALWSAYKNNYYRFINHEQG